MHVLHRTIYHEEYERPENSTKRHFGVECIHEKKHWQYRVDMDDNR